MLPTAYLFGANFRQDNSFLYISKSDYPEFLSKTDLSGQDVLVILLKRLIRLFFGELEDNKGINITDHNNQEITFDHSWLDSFYVSLARTSIKYKKDAKYRVSHIKVAFRYSNNKSSSIPFDNYGF